MLIVHSVDRFLAKIEVAVMMISGFAVMALTIAATILRSFYIDIAWYEEVDVLLYSILVFWGASYVARDDSHLKLDLLGVALIKMERSGRLEPVHRMYYTAFIELFCLVLSIAGAYFSAQFSLSSIKATPILGIPGAVTLFLSIFAAFAGLAVRYAIRLIITIQGALWERRVYQ